MNIKKKNCIDERRRNYFIENIVEQVQRASENAKSFSLVPIASKLFPTENFQSKIRKNLKNMKKNLKNLSKIISKNTKNRLEC